MATKRRYRREEHPFYDKRHDAFRVSAPMLNAKVRAESIRFCVFDVTNKESLSVLRAEWMGNERGEYERNNEPCPAYIPAVEHALKELERQLEQYQQTQVNTGHARPGEPVEMYRKRLELEAKLDCYLEELEQIEKWLEFAVEVKEHETDVDVLHRGPRGGGKLLHGFLHMVDGQRCEQVNGIITIVDERSPYNGMMTADYYGSVVKPWHKAKRTIRHARDRVQVRYPHRDEFPEKWAEEHAKIMKQNPHFKDLFAHKKEGCPNMPSWPKGIKKNILKTDENGKH